MKNNLYFTSYFLSNEEKNKLEYLFKKLENNEDKLLILLTYSIIIDYFCFLLIKHNPASPGKLNIALRSFETTTLGKKIKLLKQLNDDNYSDVLQLIEDFSHLRNAFVHKFFTQRISINRIEESLDESILIAQKICKSTEYFFNFIAHVYYFD